MNEPSLEQVVEVLYPRIFFMVRLTMRLYSYHAHDNEIEDLSHEIAVLLIEDDFRRLRTFDKTKASIKTWLKTVVMHHVGRHIHRQAARNLNEMSESDMRYGHEDEMLSAQEHRRAEIQDALKRLTRREQQLFDLLCEDGMSAREIADHMRIQVDSVYRRKHALVQKLRSLVLGGWGIGKFRSLV